MTPTIKLQHMTAEDAELAAEYLTDRGYNVKLLGSAVVCDRPDAADLAVCQVTFRGYTVDVTEWDVKQLRYEEE